MKYKVNLYQNETVESELPALELLDALGYTYMTDSEVNQLRKKDSDVILYKILEQKIIEFNPWLKNNQDAVTLAIERIREDNFAHNRSHSDTNEIIHAMYAELSMDEMRPLEIPFDLGNGEENQTVHLFDFKHPEKNDFIVTNQLAFKGHKIKPKPDITIFVNGFPLVIIECKDPNITEPIEEAVQENLTRYQTKDNGLDRLFFYNLFLVATCGDYAKHGCIDADVNFYSRWSSTYPYTTEEVEKLAKRKSREQEKLIAGMLNKKTLIDLLENYVVFDKIDGHNIKKLAKHQQFRAVSKAIERLEISFNSASNLGGTVWHSQGSGKSLTMFWLAKQIRQHFGGPLILVVTDRTSLDDQIHKNFASAGWNRPIRAKNAKHLLDELISPKKKVIMSTIQKLGLKSNPDVLSTEQLIVLTDESHRSEFGEIATRMRNALPNAIFFAFTATPIDKPYRKVFEKFGPEIDNYTWSESKLDGVTVGIEYRPRWVHIHIDDAKLLSEEFEKEFSGLTKEQKNKIKRDHIKMNNLRRATERINGIAKDIVKDFNSRVGIEGFKAMIVASNREAAVRYKKALDSIPNSPKSILIMTSNLGESGIDGTSWDDYYFSSKDREIKSKEFAKSENENQILIVSDMLLTGYDAPIIQTMYLDHKLKEHTLLQAIARVNRKYGIKQNGVVVDYCNVSKELEDAKRMFDAIQTKDLTIDKGKLISDLKSSWNVVMSDVKGIDPEDRDSVLEQFSKEDKRDTFYTHYKKFERALDTVMPEPEANEFFDDFAKLTTAIIHIRNYLNRDKFSTKPYSKKIQKLFDKYVSIGKITTPIEGIEFDDEQFASELKKIKKRNAQNAALAGRISAIIKMKRPDNPAFYSSIEEQLNELLAAEEEERYDAYKIFEGLFTIYKEAIEEEKRRNELGLENGFEFAVYGEIKGILNNQTKCVKFCIDVFEKISPLTRYVDWPDKIMVRKEMEKSIYEILSINNFPEEKIDQITEKIIDLAKRHMS